MFTSVDLRPVSRQMSSHGRKLFSSSWNIIISSPLRPLYRETQGTASARIGGPETWPWFVPRRSDGVHGTRTPTAASFVVENDILTNIFGCYRRVEIETKLVNDPAMSDERKRRQLAQLGKTESMFLRLKRTKIGLADFRTVKLIGAGAFGEVSYGSHFPWFITGVPLGSPCAEGRHGENIRDEDLAKG